MCVIEFKITYKNINPFIFRCKKSMFCLALFWSILKLCFIPQFFLNAYSQHIPGWSCLFFSHKTRKQKLSFASKYVVRMLCEKERKNLVTKYLLTTPCWPNFSNAQYILFKYKLSLVLSCCSTYQYFFFCFFHVLLI